MTGWLVALIVVGSVVAYFAIGCAFFLCIKDVKPDYRCRRGPDEHSPRCYSRHSSVTCDCKRANGHSEYCHCLAYAVAGGILWPFTAIFLAVWAVVQGRKQPKKTRLGRAQRKARKVQEYIDQLEKDLGLVDDK